MTRRTIATYAAVAAFALASGPALWAQERPNPGQSSGSSAGARPNPSGGSSGSAVSRPSGGGSTGGSTSSSSGGSSSGGSSMGGFNSGGDSGGYRPARPERRPEASRAVPRTGSSANSGEQRRISPRGAAAAASAGENVDPRRRAVPTYARPRDGRNVTGSAVDRRLAPPTRPGGDIFIDPYYRYNYYFNRYPYGFYSPGYGFGLGYFYDPWLWGFGPTSFYDPYYSGGYGYGGGYTRYREGEYRPVGSIRLKVEPREAQVYVDGYYVGEVDSFDGIFQKLTIEEGAHRVEIRAPGFETAQFEVMIIPGETITYKGEMKRMQ